MIIINTLFKYVSTCLLSIHAIEHLFIIIVLYYDWCFLAAAQTVTNITLHYQNVVYATFVLPLTLLSEIWLSSLWLCRLNKSLIRMLLTLFPTNMPLSFLDALASLDLMIDTDWLTHSLTQRQQSVTQNGMSLKMDCHSKWNVSQNGMSLKIECHSKWNVTQSGMSFKMECHSK